MDSNEELNYFDEFLLQHFVCSEIVLQRSILIASKFN